MSAQFWERVADWSDRLSKWAYLKRLRAVDRTFQKHREWAKRYREKKAHEPQP